MRSGLPKQPAASEDDATLVSGADKEAQPILRAAAVGVVAAALLFNPVLAWINGHIVPLSGAVVTGVQGLIIAAAAAVGVLGRRPGTFRWLGFMWAAVLIWLTLSLLRQGPDLKFLGDAVLIPAFALAGSCLDRRSLIRLLLAAQTVIAVAAAWDLFAPDSYGEFLQIRAYYVNTRGFSDEAFWSQNANLFLSAERPDARMFFPNSGLHRAASIFLEPVSLGNWAVIVTILLLALWKSLSIPARLILVSTIPFLLVACDGRFSALASVFVLLSYPIAVLAPRWFPLLYLPFVMVVLLVMRGLGMLPEGADSFTGRLNKAAAHLQNLDLPGLLGLDSGGVAASADAGWAYLIQSQSIFGLIGFWMALILFNPSNRLENRLFVSGVAIFFALNMPVSYSFISIKSAAFIFAVYGFLVTSSLQGRQAQALLKRGSARRVPLAPAQ